jgi:telomerase reverse transcriptase
MLCRGYQRAIKSRTARDDYSIAQGISEVISRFPNPHVTTVKGSSWAQLLKLMGRDGEQIMLDLISDCGIFRMVQTGRNNYYQISGKSYHYQNEL